MAVQKWMARRRGESVKKWHERLNRTCFACGKQLSSMSECNAHEETCAKATRTGNRRG